MYENQKEIHMVVINTLEKKVKIGMLQVIDEKNPFMPSRKLAELEKDVSLYVLPLLDMKSGKKTSSKCFICTDNDIIETEGIGFIPFNDEQEAVSYMDKIKTMIEWQI